MNKQIEEYDRSLHDLKPGDKVVLRDGTVCAVRNVWPDKKQVQVVWDAKRNRVIEVYLCDVKRA